MKLIPGYDTRLIYVMPSGTSLYLGAVHRLLVCGSGTFAGGDDDEQPGTDLNTDSKVNLIADIIGFEVWC